MHGRDRVTGVGPSGYIICSTYSICWSKSIIFFFLLFRLILSTTTFLSGNFLLCFCFCRFCSVFCANSASALLSASALFLLRQFYFYMRNARLAFFISFDFIPPFPIHFSRAITCLYPFVCGAVDCPYPNSLVYFPSVLPPRTLPPYHPSIGAADGYGHRSIGQPAGWLRTVVWRVGSYI